MATLTKREIVIQISNESGLIQKDVLTVVQRTLDIIADTLAKGDTVELRNFGVFEVRLTKSKVGRNPKVPNSEVKIPPAATVKFKTGKLLKERLEKLTPTLKRQE